MRLAKRRWRDLVTGALVAFASGCSILAPDGGLEEEMQDARAAWEALEIHDYAVTMRPICECLPEWIPAAVVIVRADTILAVQDFETGEPVEHRYHYRTVDGLFDLLQDAFDQDVVSVGAGYDPSHHYPTTIWIDYELNTADEEIGYTVWNLVPQRN